MWESHGCWQERQDPCVQGKEQYSSTATAISRGSAQFNETQFHRARHMPWVALQKRNPKLREPKSFIMGVILPDLFPRGKRYPYCMSVNKPTLCSGERQYLYLHGYLLHKQPWKDNQKQRRPVPLLSQQYLNKWTYIYYFIDWKTQYC